ncbi:glycoside hydrolase family 25 protein [Ferruginibacter yonginensis]|uniref:Glycoside hydrolase family 25 protein n=1 Tax=Ferruginibacter yonginensis TaxID=1310416 RepID=A0ABV8QSL2_9BACT
MAKKVRRLGRNIFLFVLFMALASLAAFYLSDYYYEPPFKHYNKFGIDLPTQYNIHGIDVSRHQNRISWDDVKAMKVNNIGISFAFMKATEGTDFVDEQLNNNMRNAKEVGITRGAYHFFTGSKSGKAQAIHFLEHVSLKKGDLPPVLDVEQANGASVTDVQQRVADWLSIIEKVYKVKPIIYSNVDFYKTYLAGRFDSYPLWVAHYFVKDKPRIDRNWVFWQHNENGLVNGIRSKVDFNVFNGDSTAFSQLLIQ